jgi:hypothetical protein
MNLIKHTPGAVNSHGTKQWNATVRSVQLYSDLSNLCKSEVCIYCIYINASNIFSFKNFGPKIEMQEQTIWT